MKSVFRNLSFYSAHFFVTGMGFYLLQFLYAKSAYVILLNNWEKKPILLIVDRVIYGLIFVIIAWIIYYKILPALLLPGLKKSVHWNFSGRSSHSEQESKPLMKSFLGGASVGWVLFIMIWMIVFFFPESPVNAKNPELALLLKQDFVLFLWYLMSSGIFTPVFEEFFYRGCLCGYMIHTSQFLMQNHSYKDKTREKSIICQINQKMPLLFALATSFFFAIVHTEHWILMLFAGGVFATLYWKQGLWSAISAHVVYNCLILFAGTYIQN